MAATPAPGGNPPPAGPTAGPTAGRTAGPPPEPTAGPLAGGTADPLADAFKNAMASLCSPVTVVTALHGGTPRGVTVSAIASLSLAPPMVTVALDRRSSILPAIESTGRLGVCVLDASDHEVALAFASAADRFARTAWHLEDGLPRLSTAPGWLACEAAQVVDGGDHVIVLGRVVAVDVRPATTLAYQNRRFGVHTPFPVQQRQDRETRAPRPQHLITHS
jgi:flavin reductase (DIM6/NTAB) family NADH-FMN oxidoreductase RutF